LSEPALAPARPRIRGLVIVAFVVYLVLLAWVVLWKLQLPFIGESNARVIKLVPYVSAGGDGGSGLLEAVVNGLLFVPFGAFLGLLSPSWKWWKHLMVVTGVSVAFEVAQYILAVGSSDVTDVIDNTLGGLVGLGLLALVRRGSKQRGGTAVSWVLVVGTGVFLVAAVLFFLSPLHFHDPRR
jgi:glycopeptide antibiotics resistance protein